jgi:hypothetical protein
MPQYQTDFAVLESRWEDDSNISVKPMFDFISHRYLSDAYNAIPYERFVSLDALRHAVDYFRDCRRISSLYIGCHGDENGLDVIYGDYIKASDLLDIVSNPRHRETNKGKISGLFIGSCSFCNEENVYFLMDNEPQLKWVAGYDRDCDWGYGTMLDGLFMIPYVRQQRRKIDRMEKYIDGHYEYRTADMIERAFYWTKLNHSGLISRLGFNVYIKRNQNSEVINLNKIDLEPKRRELEKFFEKL